MEITFLVTRRVGVFEDNVEAGMMCLLMATFGCLAEPHANSFRARYIGDVTPSVRIQRELNHSGHRVEENPSDLSLSSHRSCDESLS
jgi:hypothetical protein